MYMASCGGIHRTHGFFTRLKFHEFYDSRKYIREIFIILYRYRYDTLQAVGTGLLCLFLPITVLKFLTHYVQYYAHVETVLFTCII